MTFCDLGTFRTKLFNLPLLHIIETLQFLNFFLISDSVSLGLEYYHEENSIDPKISI